MSGAAGGPGGGFAGSADPAVSGVPTCFRHPDRETYVSCVRCGRYACPDCLRAAAVGQQCVDCVRGGNRAVRQPRTAFGGRVPSGAAVTWALVAINVVLFVIELGKPSLGTDWGMLGAATDGNGALIGVGAGQWYRLITSAFLPPATGLGGLGFMDILFNMWALIFVGPALERLLGPVRFFVVYMLSAVGGAVCYYYLAPLNALALGASGAIFGLFGAWFVVSRRLHLDTRGIAGLIVINLVLSFTLHSIIAWQDHVGGLVTGGIITAAFAYAPGRQRFLYQAGATAAVIAVLVALVLVRNGQVTGI